MQGKNGSGDVGPGQGTQDKYRVAEFWIKPGVVEIRSKVSGIGYINRIRENLLNVRKRELASLYEDTEVGGLCRLRRVGAIAVLAERGHEPDSHQSHRLEKQGCIDS